MSWADEESHRRLEKKLISGRVAGTITEAEEDAISEEMADCWYRMDALERERARDRVAVLRAEFPQAFETKK